MNRRSFFASLAAVAAAPFVPKPAPKPLFKIHSIRSDYLLPDCESTWYILPTRGLRVYPVPPVHKEYGLGFDVTSELIENR